MDLGVGWFSSAVSAIIVGINVTCVACGGCVACGDCVASASGVAGVGCGSCGD